MRSLGLKNIMKPLAALPVLVLHALAVEYSQMNNMLTDVTDAGRPSRFAIVEPARHSPVQH